MDRVNKKVVIDSVQDFDDIVKFHVKESTRLHTKQLDEVHCTATPHMNFKRST